MISASSLRDLAKKFTNSARLPKKLRIFTDSSDFFRVDYNDILILGERPYLIRNYEHEGRFGIEDQPKFWVKRAIDLATGSLKIIKMVFHEKFPARIGDLVFECFRSPAKEARILDLVRSHPNFVHGFSEHDSAGNLLRVLDYIHGKTLPDYAETLGSSHEDYFHNFFPAVLDEFIQLVRAISFLHDQGEKHGDIRRDHIIKDRASGTCRWIDFDFDYWHRENMYGYDLFGLGNILIFLVGRGDITTQNLRQKHPSLYSNLAEDDLNIVFTGRVANLKKIYPYLPDALNVILLHFSLGAETYYDNTAQLLSDLEEARGIMNR